MLQNVSTARALVLMFLAGFVPVLVRVLLHTHMDPGAARTTLIGAAVVVGAVSFWFVLWSWKRAHDRRHENDWPRHS